MDYPTEVDESGEELRRAAHAAFVKIVEIADARGRFNASLPPIGRGGGVWDDDRPLVADHASVAQYVKDHLDSMIASHAQDVQDGLCGPAAKAAVHASLKRSHRLHERSERAVRMRGESTTQPQPQPQA